MARATKHWTAMCMSQSPGIISCLLKVSSISAVMESSRHRARKRMWKVSCECDTEGGTGAQWGCVKSILYNCWAYGGEMDQPDLFDD